MDRRVRRAPRSGGDSALCPWDVDGRKVCASGKSRVADGCRRPLKRHICQPCTTRKCVYVYGFHRRRKCHFRNPCAISKCLVADKLRIFWHPADSQRLAALKYLKITHIGIGRQFRQSQSCTAVKGILLNRSYSRGKFLESKRCTANKSIHAYKSQIIRKLIHNQGIAICKSKAPNFRHAVRQRNLSDCPLRDIFC